MARRRKKEGNDATPARPCMPKYEPPSERATRAQPPRVRAPPPTQYHHMGRAPIPWPCTPHHLFGVATVTRRAPGPMSTRQQRLAQAPRRLHAARNLLHRGNITIRVEHRPHAQDSPAQRAAVAPRRHRHPRQRSWPTTRPRGPHFPKLHTCTKECRRPRTRAARGCALRGMN
jgi:hypothetical protein